MIRARRLPRIAPVSPAERPVYVLVAAWVLAMIGIPILRWTFGDDALPIGITIGVLLQVIAVSLAVISAWGVRRGLLTLGVIVALAWLTEFIGSKTGFPFGSYDYTARLQPQLGGVPLLIPLAWLMMLPPAWVCLLYTS
ncbi:MAG: carotenoid biosynthesis protein, partial [Anaerolinea sp.]|nr:carotenoid biosynthesis protein [Anaerolinea sp.]